MGIILGIMASLIFLLYSIYFVKIIKGEPQDLELEVIRSMADWIIVKGAATKTYLWAMFGGSLLAEAIYFYLVLVLIPNPTLRIMTAIFIPVEIFHLTRLALNLNWFFRGKYLLSQVFNWRLERFSALLFFTHSFLVLVIIFFFS
ncbi:MAG: hypothetical protein PHQ94_00595 [Syntrophomonas sp.]|nr:hypothetical protein [Syntrophomonas sp.]